MQRLLSEIDSGHRRQQGQYLHIAPIRLDSPRPRRIHGAGDFLIGIIVGLLFSFAIFQYTVAFAAEPDAMLGFEMQDPAPLVEPEPLTIPELVCSYRWSCQEALRVMHCESRGDPLAASAGGDRGLFQINPVHRARVGGNLSRLHDPETNVAVAWAIYSEQGWRPWACRP